MQLLSNNINITQFSEPAVYVLSQYGAEDAVKLSIFGNVTPSVKSTFSNMP